MNDKTKHGHDQDGGAVHFFCHASDAQGVAVAGTFNEWQPDATPMTRVGDGGWETSLPLSPGRYEYKFVVDGQWVCEPGCEHEYRGCPKCVSNEFGTMNRVLEVT
jgi:1,4-alpha-glucan branching enzyme